MSSSRETSGLWGHSRSLSRSLSVSGGTGGYGNRMSRASASGTSGLWGQSRTLSVSGGTGGTRISSASTSGTSGLWGQSRTSSVSSSVFGGTERTSVSSASASASRGNDVLNNDKETMKNLNERLAFYLEQVRSLESSNKSLESQIREYCEKNDINEKAKDYSTYFTIITDLRNKISNQLLENQSISVQMRNIQLTADDFRLKADQEVNLCSSVQADVSRLRSARDSLTQTNSGLERQVQGLQEELDDMKKNHKEEMLLLRAQQGSVKVEVDSAESGDLSTVLRDVRQQYETLMDKNKSELHSWFQAKVESFKTENKTVAVETKSFHTELQELKKTYKSYKISQESLLSEVGCLRQSLEEVQACGGEQLLQLQVNIDALEAELQRLRVSMETQMCEYSTLLDLKMRLELEIEEYRRLLGGELHHKTVTVSKVEETVKERKPHMERRTRTIIEEIVDGVVVNHKVDTQIEDIE